MSHQPEHGRDIDHTLNPQPPDEPSIDMDQSGALAIGLMVAIVCLVALLTLALFISIP